jgi:hypothetical protein
MVVTEQLLFGFITMIMGGLGTYIVMSEKRHRKERKEWAERDERNFDRMNETADETNKVIRENTNILSGLKTLLENRRH